jgi:hypothetical protein
MGGLARGLVRAVAAAGSLVLFGYALLACTASFLGAGVDAPDRQVGGAFIAAFLAFGAAFVLGSTQ